MHSNYLQGDEFRICHANIISGNRSAKSMKVFLFRSQRQAHYFCISQPQQSASNVLRNEFFFLRLAHGHSWYKMRFDVDVTIPNCEIFKDAALMPDVGSEGGIAHPELARPIVDRLYIQSHLSQALDQPFSGERNAEPCSGRRNVNLGL